MTATDSGGLFDTAAIYVNITDANNFAPIFDNAPYTASIYEDAPVGSTVLVVSATDGDVGQNALVSIKYVWFKLKIDNYCMVFLDNLFIS